MMLEKEIFTGSPVSRQNTLLPRLAATARRWWPPIRILSSDALAMISPTSSHDDFHGPPLVQGAGQRRRDGPQSNLLSVPAFQPTSRYPQLAGAHATLRKIRPVSAPRLPQAWHTNLSSMSDSRR